MSKHVSCQVTDAVTQTNVQVLGGAPAMSLGTVYQTAAHSTGLMFHNAVNAQNNQFVTGLTATTQGVLQLYSQDTLSAVITIANQLKASK